MALGQGHFGAVDSGKKEEGPGVNAANPTRPSKEGRGWVAGLWASPTPQSVVDWF